jgi:IMP dehydrogenase
MYLLKKSIARVENLIGIVTSRDLRLTKDSTSCAKDIMTPLKDIESIRVQNIKDIMSPIEIREKMVKKRVEKLPILNDDDEILGLVTFKDIERVNERPSANLDSKGRLYVGAAVGANDIQRAKRLEEAGVDVLVVDVANGHGKLCLDTVRELK